MKTISFISLHDEFCLDARYTSAMLRHDRHTTHTIFFKGNEYTSPENMPPADRQDPNGYYAETSYTSPREVELLIQALKNQSPDLVVFFFHAPYLGLAKHLTQAVKSQLNTPVLWAGQDCNFAPEENIQHTDFICIGEPEYPIRHFVQALERGESPETQAGIWANRGGEITRNPTLLFEDHIDRFPYPDFAKDNKWVVLDDQILNVPFPPKSHLHTNLIMRVSRSCPVTCPYCQRVHDGLEHTGINEDRLRSPDNVIDEIKYRLATWPSPIERVEFHDDFFPMDRDWVAHFHHRYSTEISLPFFGFTKPYDFDPEVLLWLRDSRMQGLIMRIANAPDNVFPQANHPDFIRASTQTVMDSGIKLVLECMVHHPMETENDRKQMINLIGSLPKRFSMTGTIPFNFYPNCTLHQRVQEAGKADVLEQPKGWHALRMKPTRELTFWEKLYTLAHFEGMETETILHFTQDDYMKQKPELLQEMVDNLYDSIYLNGNPLVNKEEYVHDLRWRLMQAETQSKTTPVRQAKKIAAMFR